MPSRRRGRAAVLHIESDDSHDEEVPPSPQQQCPSDHKDSQSVTAGQTEPDENANTLRILLSTDNHLGYLERDPIRGMDSFAALEEVLSLARSQRVDLVLLSGDVFHDNKPSRRTLHTTMEILRRYCMGENSVGFQIVSDQKECLRSVVTGRANYEDDYYSVDMPIFAIHGNHDDPTRDGGTEMLSALDLLSVSNLVNYFGRQDQVDKVQISPVLLQKGTTKVALYGMGSMRDERLNRMWQGKKVRFLRPEDDQDDRPNNTQNEEVEEDVENYDNGSKWFNIFTLHQNRDLGRGSKNCIHESMIPEWMDLVVWGHEHECLITPSESLVGTFRITQPGSSVATSLTMGESRRKHVGVLDIRGQRFRLKAVPLKSVRSFALGEASLSDMARNGLLDKEDPKVEDKISDLLANEVEKIMLRAREEAQNLQLDADNLAHDAMQLEDEFSTDIRQRKYQLQFPEQVLVRLRVEHSGFATLNNQRFGSKFVGKVANPSDILLFHRRRQAENATTKDAASRKKQIAAGLNLPIEPEELEEINVEDLINENLFKTEKKLELLNEREMAEALDDFVAKEQRQAISDKAAEILQQSQLTLTNRGKKDGGDGVFAADNASAVREFCKSKSEKARAEFTLEREELASKKKSKEGEKSQRNIQELTPSSKQNSQDLSDDDFVSKRYIHPSSINGKPVTTSTKSTSKVRRIQRDDSDDNSNDSDPPPSKKRVTTSIAKVTTTTKKAVAQKYSPPRTTRSRPVIKPKYNYDDSDIDEEKAESDDEEIEEVSTVSARRQQHASQHRSTKTINPSPSSTRRGRAVAKRPNYYDDSDEDDDPKVNSGSVGWGIASSQSTHLRRGRR